MPRQGSKSTLYNYRDLAYPKDDDQEKRDLSKIEWIKANWLRNPEKVKAKIAEFDEKALLRLSTRDSYIKELFSSAALEEIWKEKLKNRSSYYSYPIENSSIFDVWMGHCIFSYYKDFFNENLRTDLDAQELLNEACKRHVWVAHQWRCMNAIDNLRESQTNDIALYLHYAEEIASRFSTIGCFEAARLCFRAVEFLERKISNASANLFFRHTRIKLNESYQYTVFGHTIRAVLQKGFHFLHNAQEQFNTQKSQLALEIAFGKGNVSAQRIFEHYNLPVAVQDFPSAIHFFEDYFSKYLLGTTIINLIIANSNRSNTSPAA